MKYTKYILGLAMAAMLVACHKYDEPKGHYYLDENSPEVWAKTHSIQEFLAECLTEFGTETEDGKLKYVPRPGSYTDDKVSDDTKTNNFGLFSVDDITKDIVIVGRVVSSDVGGNIYKTVYIQDCDHPEQGLKIGVDAGSISGFLPRGQKIAIRVKGLCVGKYAKTPQLGMPYYNDSKEGLDKVYKIGWEVGRIPLSIFKEHIQLIGIPDASQIKPTPMTISEIAGTVAVAGSERTSSDFLEIAKLTSRLVTIEGIHFTQCAYEYGEVKNLYERNKADDPEAMYAVSNKYSLLFAPTTYSGADQGKLGYPQNRIFVCGSDTLAIGTSEYAKFAHAILPNCDIEDCFVNDTLGVTPETYVGTITGFISFYDDRVGQSRYADNKLIEKGAWTITINSLDDIKLTNAQGKAWKAPSVFYPAY